MITLNDCTKKLIVPTVSLSAKTLSSCYALTNSRLKMNFPLLGLLPTENEIATHPMSCLNITSACKLAIAVLCVVSKSAVCEVVTKSTNVGY